VPAESRGSRTKGSPYSLGYDAGAYVAFLMLGRSDHETCAVEWYRGFCAGSNQEPSAKVEAAIVRYFNEPGSRLAENATQIYLDSIETKNEVQR
jgi:hypothetical protein